MATRRIGPLLAILNLNTRLLQNCLDRVDEATAQRRPNEHTNSMAFVALHLVDARYYLAGLLGSKAHSPFQEQLADVDRIEDVGEYPPLAKILVAWSDAEVELAGRLGGLEREDLDRKCEQQFPIDDTSMLGAIVFLLQHEAYHVGQMALMRKWFGFGAMEYT